MEHLIISTASYFLLYSFLGWMLETAFKSILAKKFINSGFLHGPACPIYGVGALIMVFCLDWFKDKYVLLFLVSIVVLSIWEYIVGWYLEKVFKTKYWDYSDKKFNIHGRVCLENSLYWGVLGVVFIQFLHPFLSEQVMRIPQNILIYINVLLYMYMLTDGIVTIIKVNNINIKFNALADIREKLKALEEGVDIDGILADLREKEAALRDLLERRTRRLRKAFPTMKSENITKHLAEKLEEIRTRIKG